MVFDSHPLHAVALDLIERRLDFLTKHLSSHVAIEAARYLLLQSGRRLRPLFLLSVLEGFNTSLKSGLDAACALELIHTYSLIHDDLPCMDDDALRRGLPTVHKKYSEAIAVLAGDYLLTLAFEVLSTSCSIPEEKKCSLITALSKYAGGQGMIEGQIIDITTSNSRSSIDLKKLYERKTAALFVCALSMGATLANISEEDAGYLKEMGRHFGLAYQYLDDLDDVDQDKGCSPLQYFSNDFLEKELKTHLSLARQSLKKLSKPCTFLYYLLEYPFKKAAYAIL